MRVVTPHFTQQCDGVDCIVLDCLLRMTPCGDETGLEGNYTFAPNWEPERRMSIIESISSQPGLLLTLEKRTVKTMLITKTA